MNEFQHWPVRPEVGGDYLMRTFEHFNASHGDVCPICNTAKDCETVLVPIPGTEDGNICEARQIHKRCYDLVIEMDGLSGITASESRL